MKHLAVENRNALMEKAAISITVQETVKNMQCDDKCWPQVSYQNKFLYQAAVVSKQFYYVEM